MIKKKSICIITIFLFMFLSSSIIYVIGGGASDYNPEPIVPDDDPVTGDPVTVADLVLTPVDESFITPDPSLDTDLGTGTDFDDFDEYSNDMSSILGDFADLKDDYLSIAYGSSNDNYIKTEIGGVGITNFEREGQIGLSMAGNPLYRYGMTCEFTILTYTTYGINYYFDLQSYESEPVTWLSLYGRDLGISWGTTYTYDLTYKEYRLTDETYDKKAGEALSVPITVDFKVPYQSQEILIGGTLYKIAGIKSEVISLTTSGDPAVSGFIAKGDARYDESFVSDSVQIDLASRTVVDISASDNYANVAEPLQLAIDSASPGFKSESDPVRVTAVSHNTIAMSTNARLASGGEQDSLTGHYNVNIGSQACYYKRDFEIRHGSFYYDKWWPGYSAGLIDAKTVRGSRITDFVVYNNYIKQNLIVEVDLYSELEAIDAEITDPADMNMTEPTELDPFEGDDDFYGDFDVEVGMDVIDLESLFGISGFQIIMVIVAIVAVIIIGLVLYMKFSPQGRIMSKMLKKKMTG